MNIINKNFYELYFIETLLDFSGEEKLEMKVAINRMIFSLYHKHISLSLTTDEKKIFFGSLIKKILSSKYVNNKKKELIRKKLLSSKSLNFSLAK